MFKFNNNHIATGYIKQLLASFNLPTYKVYTREFEQYKDAHGVEDPRIAASVPKDGNTYPDHMCYVNYIKDGLVQRYDGLNWIPTQYHYHYNKKELNKTKNLKIRNNLYDSYTHEYLGEYLRFQRDYNNLDLMPLYNCFSDTLCPLLRTTFNTAHYVPQYTITSPLFISITPKATSSTDAEETEDTEDIEALTNTVEIGTVGYLYQDTAGRYFSIKLEKNTENNLVVPPNHIELPLQEGATLELTRANLTLKGSADQTSAAIQEYYDAGVPTKLPVFELTPAPENSAVYIVGDRISTTQYSLSLSCQLEYTTKELNSDKEVDYKAVVFDTKDPNYKIYMLPVKLFHTYTIALGCNSAEIFCGFYSGNYFSEAASLTNLPKLTYQKFTDLQFSTPIIYDKLSASNILAPEATAGEYLQNEHNLKMFIKLPANTTSSIVVLEGDYSSYNNTIFSQTTTWNDGEGLPDELGALQVTNDSKYNFISEYPEAGALYISTQETATRTQLKTKQQRKDSKTITTVKISDDPLEVVFPRDLKDVLPDISMIKDNAEVAARLTPIAVELANKTIANPIKLYIDPSKQTIYKIFDEGNLNNITKNDHDFTIEFAKDCLPPVKEEWEIDFSNFGITSNTVLTMQPGEYEYEFENNSYKYRIDSVNTYTLDNSYAGTVIVAGNGKVTKTNKDETVEELSELPEVVFDDGESVETAYIVIFERTYKSNDLQTIVKREKDGVEQETREYPAEFIEHLILNINDPQITAGDSLQFNFVKNGQNTTALKLVKGEGNIDCSVTFDIHADLQLLEELIDEVDDEGNLVFPETPSEDWVHGTVEDEDGNNIDIAEPVPTPNQILKITPVAYIDYSFNIPHLYVTEDNSKLEEIAYTHEVNNDSDDKDSDEVNVITETIRRLIFASSAYEYANFAETTKDNPQLIEYPDITSTGFIIFKDPNIDKAELGKYGNCNNFDLNTKTILNGGRICEFEEAKTITPPSIPIASKTKAIVEIDGNKETDLNTKYELQRYLQWESLTDSIRLSLLNATTLYIYASTELSGCKLKLVDMNGKTVAACSMTHVEPPINHIDDNTYMYQLSTSVGGVFNLVVETDSAIGADNPVYIYYIEAQNDLLFNGVWERRTNKFIINFEDGGDVVPVEERVFKPITNLQLLQLNTGVSYPIADRLLEYLLFNAVTHLDNNADNIKRVQKVMANNGHTFEFDGAWEAKMRNIIYAYMTNGHPTGEKFNIDVDHDVLGYVDRDVEKYYTSWQAKALRDSKGQPIYYKDKHGNPIEAMVQARLAARDGTKLKDNPGTRIKVDPVTGAEILIDGQQQIELIPGRYLVIDVGTGKYLVKSKYVPTATIANVNIYEDGE